MIASFCGDSFVCSIRNPFEVVKQQMQLGLHKTTLDAVRTIAAVDGVKGFYAGALPTLARDLPFGACQFLMYEALKRRLIEYRGAALGFPA